MKKTLLLSLLLLTALSTYAQSGALDPSFGSGGYTLAKRPGFAGTHFQDGVLQSDGKIIAIGWVETSSRAYDFVIARFLANGSMDPSFGDAGFTVTDFGYNDLAWAVAIQHDGKIVVGGRSQTGVGLQATALARYHTNGSLDNSFGIGGKIVGELSLLGDEVDELFIQADNKIIAAGISGSLQGFILRFNGEGTPDESFGTLGRIATAGMPVSVIVQPDEKILVAEHIDGTTGLSRYNSDGSLDDSFGDHGAVVVTSPAITGSAHAMVLQDDGRIVVSGWTQVIGSGRDDSDIYLARFNPDGKLDPSFGSGGEVTTDINLQLDFAQSVTGQKDGKVLVGGATQKLSSSPDKPDTLDFVLVRYNADGSPDPSFGTDGIVKTNFYVAGKPASALINKLLSAGSRTYAIGILDVYDYFNSMEDYQSFNVGIVAAYTMEEEGVVMLSCPASIVVPTDADQCYAVVNNIGPVLTGGAAATSFRMSGASTASGTGSAGGSIFNKGNTTVMYSLTNDPAKTCTFTVTVNDIQSPQISKLVAMPSVLWPPNHKMQTVTVNYDSRDNCGVNGCQVTVSSDQPVNDNGDGNTSPDWEVVNDHQVRLRAETSGSNTPQIHD